MCSTLLPSIVHYEKCADLFCSFDANNPIRPNFHFICQLVSSFKATFLASIVQESGVRVPADRPLRIVWPHRWEHDKNPESFFDALFKLQDEEDLDFRVSVLGQSFEDVPEIFQEAKTRLGPKIVHFGRLESRADYLRCSFRQTSSFRQPTTNFSASLFSRRLLRAAFRSYPTGKTLDLTFHLIHRGSVVNMGPSEPDD